MMLHRLVVSSVAVLFLSMLTGDLVAQTAPSAGMLRYPDVSQDRIVFCYAGDLWTVPKKGGIASPLASPAGHERSPKFNHDGSMIAFVGNYEGNSDIYEISTGGGTANRITYHPGSESLCGYGADGEFIYSTSSFARLDRMQQLFSISAEEPVPVQLPVPYGTNASVSDDGDWLAYTPYSRDTRTWKRYRGGMASDIWLFNLQDQSARQITDWEGTDSFPMWHGDQLYYLSDAGRRHRLNIWTYDIDSGERTQITRFKTFDVKSPSMGPGSDDQGEIVFQVGSSLRLLDLETGKSRVVKVTIPGDRPALRPHIIDAADFARGRSISPSAKRVTLEARGDIWTLPVEHGSPRNLTRTSGVAERSPAWSPDGQWLAYFSDASGEYQLMIMQSDGVGETKQLTKRGSAFRFNPYWSPDSKNIFFYDQTGAMFIHDVESGKTKEIDRDPYANGPSASWSHDSQWLAYTRGLDAAPRTQIRAYHVPSGESQAVSSGYFNDDNPAFDRTGDFLFYASLRDFSSPEYEDVGTTFVYSDTEVLIAVPLRKDVENPLLPQSDEETWKSDEEDTEQESSNSKEKEPSNKRKKNAAKKQGKKQRTKGKKADKQKQSDKAKGRAGDGGSDDADPENSETGDKDADEKPEPVEIDFDDIEKRSFRIPIPAGSFRSLEVTADDVLAYVRSSTKGKDGGPAIKLVEFKDGKAKEETVVDGGQGFELTADGKQMLVFAKGDFYVVKASKGQKLEKKISTDGMRLEINRREEWRQVFTDAWRLERDFFYDPNMHGVNWKAVRKRYEKLLDDCTSRYDLSFVIREMISEINVGHAYYREGDVERGPSEPVGLLGCRFEIADDGIRIVQLWQGGDWDTDARSPLAAAGISEGDTLLAVEGVPVTPDQNPYKVFIGKVGRSVRLQVRTGDDDPRTVIVQPRGSDSQLRFWDGIEATRKRVEEESDGQIGYIYVTNTGINGQNDLFRQFYAQQEKAALIIDDRWNGGGQIPTRFIELLNRPATNYWARRDGKDWVWPPDSHQGPKCMLINGMAGSGGDMFPALFKQSGLGKLIGRRTWGGLVGITGYPRLIDGSSVTAPSFAYYETDGTWGIEGHGVDPDIDVVDDPAKMTDGGDPQLDAAIELMLEEIKSFPPAPKRPPYADRSKMGLAEEDK